MTFAAILCCLAALSGAAPADGFVEVDYAKVERSLAREPRYVAQPRYALFVFDPAGKFRVWAVLDKSKADLPYYDVAYFDKNGNGDLTEPGERFVGKPDPKTGNLFIPVGRLAVPGTDLVHTDLRFLTVESHGYKGFGFFMKWNGEQEVSGGNGKPGEDGEAMTAYGRSVRDAPVLRPTPLGPLAFAFWRSRVTLPIGKASHPFLIQVGIGSPGSGPDTFCALSEHFLVPGKDVLVATLIARDKGGHEIRSRNEIKQHC